MTTSKNERAAEVMGLRRTDGIAIDYPCELDYHCPVCVYENVVGGNYDERLEWSEYNGFLWCSVCDRDYPSALCMPDITRATDIYLDTMEAAMSQRNYHKPKPPRTEWRQKGPQRPADHAEAVRPYSEEGLTLEAIGARFDVTRERIRQWFVAAGVGNLPHDRMVAHMEAKRFRKCPRCGKTYERGKGHEHHALGAHDFGWGFWLNLIIVLVMPVIGIAMSRESRR